MFFYFLIISATAASDSLWSIEVVEVEHLSTNDTKCKIPPIVSSKCTDEFMKDSSLWKYCQSAAVSGVEIDRCCFNRTNSRLIGLDLRNCDIVDASVLQKLKSHLTLIHILSLQENTFSYETDDFRGLVSLERLEMPGGFGCPGNGFSTWEHIDDDDDRKKTVCRDQISSCTDNSCTGDNSVCLPDGPAQFQCQCDSTHSGYRCLRLQDSFPWVIVLMVWGAVTLILTLMFFWNRSGKRALRPFRRFSSVWDF